jgi:hypothetical protein
MRWVASAVLFTLAACGGGEELGLPCDADRVVANRCRGCHSSPPVYGAPMPLVAYEDFHAPAKSDPTKKVWELMKLRINDVRKPMPPGGMTREQKSPLEAWLDGGALSGECESP